MGRTVLVSDDTLNQLAGTEGLDGGGMASPKIARLLRRSQ